MGDVLTGTALVLLSSDSRLQCFWPPPPHLLTVSHLYLGKKGALQARRCSKVSVYELGDCKKLQGLGGDAKVFLPVEGC